MTTAKTKEARRRVRDKPAARPVLTLAELQRRFQDAVMAGDDAILDLIPDNSRTSHEVLLGVYRHAYVARLAEIVASDHPVLALYMGDEAFDAMARAYVAARPSHHPNVRWFSRGLPEFLSSTAPYASRPELCELALLERALNDAFDARNAPVLDLAELARHRPERWGDLCFTPHASVARLDLETNAFAMWRALKDGAAPPPVTRLDERQHLIVWRRENMSTVRTLGPEEVMMWNEAAGAVRFSVLCELVATYDDPDGAPLRAAQYLQSWIVAGMLSEARLVTATRRRG
jgi:hypothetical protein